MFEGVGKSCANLVLNFTILFQVFPGVWTASAFKVQQFKRIPNKIQVFPRVPLERQTIQKNSRQNPSFFSQGAFGEKEYVPDIQRHLQNQLSWLEVNIMD